LFGRTVTRRKNSHPIKRTERGGAGLSSKAKEKGDRIVTEGNL